MADAKEIADELERLCCAETEGKFFDYVTESVGAIVRELRAAPQWQLIETAPHGKSVLLGWRDWRDDQWCMEVGPYSHGRRVGDSSSISCHGSATHWMPLPPAPSQIGR